MQSKHQLPKQGDEKQHIVLINIVKEIALQNKIEDIEAAELVIAQIEQTFQNQEKEDNAEELTNVNNQLKQALEHIRKLNEDVIQLKSANKELESFSYSVAHDLRAPLRTVQSYVSLFKEKYGTHLDAAATKMLNIITRKAKKMMLLIDDLIALARYSSKELVKKNIPMDAIVKNICDEMGREHHEALKLEFRIGELPPVYADSVSMKQVWSNLISNAIKYSCLKEQAIIEIGAEIKDVEIIYYVKDNGAGFDMVKAKKLFGVFQRFHADHEYEGTGLGLAITHRIIARHSGRIWADAKVNLGATFYFSLPQLNQQMD